MITSELSTDGRCLTIGVKGRFDFRVYDAFRNTYADVDSAQSYVVDLASAEYMDSSALGMLLLLKEFAEANSGTVTLLRPSPEVEKILSAVGRRVDESNPMVDARLEDGSRVNVIVPPLAIDGPSLSIRRFAVDPLQAKQLVATNAITDAALSLLEAAVKGRLNILISGGTGAGKTTLLNVLSGFIPEKERIVTIEDSESPRS